MSHKDIFDILGIEPDATFDEMKKAFRRKARELHPDKTGEDDTAAAFNELKEAWENFKKDRRSGAGGRGATNSRNVYTEKAKSVEIYHVVSFNELVAGAQVEVEYTRTTAQGRMKKCVETVDLSKMMDKQKKYVKKGKGNRARNCRNGDLVINVRVDTGTFTIHGRNLHGKVDVDLFDLLCGKDILFTLPTGMQVEYVFPSSSTSHLNNITYTIPCQGFPSRSGRGDVIFFLQVRNPKLNNLTRNLLDTAFSLGKRKRDNIKNNIRAEKRSKTLP